MILYVSNWTKHISIEQCYEAQALSVELVSKWLRLYMFGGRKRSAGKARRIATHLANHSKFKSHTRHIDMDKAVKLGLKVTPLEEDQTLQDLVLSVFHATTIVFDRRVVLGRNIQYFSGDVGLGLHEKILNVITEDYPFGFFPKRYSNPYRLRCCG